MATTTMFVFALVTVKDSKGNYRYRLRGVNKQTKVAVDFLAPVDFKPNWNDLRQALRDQSNTSNAIKTPTLPVPVVNITHSGNRVSQVEFVQYQPIHTATVLREVLLAREPDATVILGKIRNVNHVDTSSMGNSRYSAEIVESNGNVTWFQGEPNAQLNGYIANCEYMPDNVVSFISVYGDYPAILQAIIHVDKSIVR